MVNLQNTVQNQLDSTNGVVMADINQIASAPVAGEKVNKEKKTLSQIIDAADDYPTSPSTAPWYEKYEWRIGNDLDDTAVVKTKNYDNSTSSPEKTESEKTVAISIGKVVSKAVKVGARKAATSSTAKNFVKKAAKKESKGLLKLIQNMP